MPSRKHVGIQLVPAGSFFYVYLMESQISQYIAVLMLLVLAVAATGGMIVLSMVLGKRGAGSKIKDTAYECGMLPIGEGSTRMSVKFYLVAMLFILFVGYIYAVKKRAFDWKS